MSNSDSTVPHGYCHCGCGQQTKLATQTRRSKGHVKGEPMQYLLGHGARYARRMEPEPLDQRIKRLVSIDDNGCWVWQGHMKPNGYGSIKTKGRFKLTHRVSYETFVGLIPDGLEIDHLCRNRRCCNPAHLEPVTHAENKQRWARLITHCPQGHEYTAENTIRSARGRSCRECARQRDRLRTQRRRNEQLD